MFFCPSHQPIFELFKKQLPAPPEGLDWKSLKIKMGYCVYKNSINISGAEYGNRNTDSSLEVSNAKIYLQYGLRRKCNAFYDNLQQICSWESRTGKGAKTLPP